MADRGNTHNRALWIATVIAAAALSGLGAFTFHYGEGLSYFSADPRACANCHIMQPQYEGWQKASHHTVAACVDCHLPTSFVAKYAAKAANGWSHSKGFTLQDFAEPIRIKPGNSAILQDNCLRCHGALVHGLLDSSTTAPDALYCVHCHASVGHGQTAGLGGRMRPAELPPPAQAPRKVDP